MKKLASFLNLNPLLITLSFLLSCSQLNPQAVPAPSHEPDLNHETSSCLCIQLWMPVCGENGKTYSNSCFAKCAKVNFKQGSCTRQNLD